MDSSDTSQSDKFQYSDFEKVGKDEWKPVEGEKNTYEYKNKNGVVLQKVTNDQGEVQYYSVTFDSNSNSASNTKYYTNSGKLVPKSKAYKIAGKKLYDSDSSNHGANSDEASSLEPGSPEWNSYMHNTSTYGTAHPGEDNDEAAPVELSEKESDWVSRKSNLVPDSSSSSNSSNKNIGVLNNPDVGKAL